MFESYTETKIYVLHFSISSDANKEWENFWAGGKTILPNESVNPQVIYARSSFVYVNAFWFVFCLSLAQRDVEIVYINPLCCGLTRLWYSRKIGDDRFNVSDYDCVCIYLYTHLFVGFICLWFKSCYSTLPIAGLIAYEWIIRTYINRHFSCFNYFEGNVKWDFFL